MRVHLVLLLLLAVTASTTSQSCTGHSDCGGDEYCRESETKECSPCVDSGFTTTNKHTCCNLRDGVGGTCPAKCNCRVVIQFLRGADLEAGGADAACELCAALTPTYAGAPTQPPTNPPPRPPAPPTPARPPPPPDVAGSGGSSPVPIIIGVVCAVVIGSVVGYLAFHHFRRGAAGVPSASTELVGFQVEEPPELPCPLLALPATPGDASTDEPPKFFFCPIPLGATAGSQFEAVVPPNHFMAGATLQCEVPAEVPIDRILRMEIDPARVVRAAGADVPVAAHTAAATAPPAPTFAATIPPGAKPGSRLALTVPPGHPMAGSTILYKVPESLPDSGVVQVPINAQDVVGAAGAIPTRLAPVPPPPPPADPPLFPVSAATPSPPSSSPAAATTQLAAAPATQLVTPPPQLAATASNATQLVTPPPPSATNFLRAAAAASQDTAAVRRPAPTFDCYIPPDSRPGSRVAVTIPAGTPLAGSTILFVVPPVVPADGRVKVPIIAANILPKNRQE